MKKYTIDDLFEAMDDLERNAKTAGEIMASLVDENPRIYEKIKKLRPKIRLDVLVTLEKIGRGDTIPELLFDHSPGARELLHLPGSQQKEFYSAPVKLVILKNGKKHQIEKPIDQLSPKEAKYAFKPIDEQVKIVELMEVVHRHAKPAQRYEIDIEGNVVIPPHTQSIIFSASQLEDICERARAKAIKSLKKAA